MKKAFSLLELIFVMLVISIIVGISLPYFTNFKDDAKLLRLKADFTNIQSALAYAENERIIKNINQKIHILDDALINLENEKLFYCSSKSINSCTNSTSCCFISLLSQPIYSSKKAWIKISSTKYRFFLNPKKYIDFEYDPNNTSFNCLDKDLCKELL